MADSTPTLVHDWPWSRQKADTWAMPGRTAHRGLCGWNDEEDENVRAKRLVVIDELDGSQSVWACCDDCYPAVKKYVGESE